MTLIASYHKTREGHSTLLHSIVEMLICLYIIVCPIGGLLPVGSTSLLSIIIVLLFFFAFLYVAFHWRKTKPFAFATIMYLIFLIQYIVDYFYGTDHFQYLLTFTLLFIFTCNLFLDKKKIIKAIYFSVILSGVLCIYFGFFGGIVQRTAVLVSGNIGLFGISTALFLDDTLTQKNNIWKIAGIIGSFTVVLFSMSRIRIALLLVLFAGKIILTIFAKNGKRKRVDLVVLFLVVFIAFLVFIFSTSGLNSLINAISGRFVNFAEDEARADEIEFGLSLFRQNVFWGSGWNAFYFRNYQSSYVQYCDHCSYVAALAHGGILFSFALFMMLFIFLTKSIRVIHKDITPVAFLGCFLVLMMTSAGLTNYSALLFIFASNLSLRRQQKDG